MCIGYTKGAIYMKKSISKILLGLGIVVALCGGASSRVEAKMPKARVTSVKATKSGKDKIKVTFKYDSKAKKKGIKKYKVRLTKYTYNESKDKWVKSGYSYVKPSAYSKNGKLKKTISLTIKNKKVDDNTVYKVQVLSANKNGTAKTSYTTAKTVGCMHCWLDQSEPYTKVVSEAVYEETNEWVCTGCMVFTGTKSEVNNHFGLARNWVSSHLSEIAEAYAKEYNTTTNEFYSYLDSTDSSDNQACKFLRKYTNEHSEYKSRIELNTSEVGSPTLGCAGCNSSITGKKIKYLVKPEVVEKGIRYWKVCTKCGATKGK